MTSYLFRPISSEEIEQTMAFIEIASEEQPNKEERHAIYAQLERSCSPSVATSRSLACFNTSCLAGIGIYFIHQLAFRDTRRLYIEDIYTPSNRTDVAEAIIQRLASLAVNEQCEYVEWSSMDYLFTDWRLPQALPTFRNVDGMKTYRLTGASLIALADI